MVLCCSRGTLSNPLMPAVHHGAVQSFLSHSYCSSGIPGLPAVWGKKEVGCRANASGCEAVHGTAGKGEMHRIEVAANAVNFVLVLHAKTVLQCCEDLKTKLRTLCTQ